MELGPEEQRKRTIKDRESLKKTLLSGMGRKERESKRKKKKSLIKNSASEEMSSKKVTEFRVILLAKREKSQLH